MAEGDVSLWGCISLLPGKECRSTDDQDRPTDSIKQPDNNYRKSINDYLRRVSSNGSCGLLSLDSLRQNTDPKKTEFQTRVLSDLLSKESCLSPLSIANIFNAYLQGEVFDFHTFPFSDFLNTLETATAFIFLDSKHKREAIRRFFLPYFKTTPAVYHILLQEYMTWENSGNTLTHTKSDSKGKTQAHQLQENLKKERFTSLAPIIKNIAAYTDQIQVLAQDNPKHSLSQALLIVSKYIQGKKDAKLLGSLVDQQVVKNNHHEILVLVSAIIKRYISPTLENPIVDLAKKSRQNALRASRVVYRLAKKTADSSKEPPVQIPFERMSPEKANNVLNQARLSEAAILQKARQVNPNDDLLAFQQAVIDIESDDIPKAIQSLRIASNLSPENNNYLHLLSLFLATQNEFDESYEIVSTIIDREPRNKDYRNHRYELGQILFQKSIAKAVDLPIDELHLAFSDKTKTYEENLKIDGLTIDALSLDDDLQHLRESIVKIHQLPVDQAREAIIALDLTAKKIAGMVAEVAKLKTNETELPEKEKEFLVNNLGNKVSAIFENLAQYYEDRANKVGPNHTSSEKTPESYASLMAMSYYYEGQSRLYRPQTEGIHHLKEAQGFFRKAALLRGNELRENTHKEKGNVHQVALHIKKVTDDPLLVLFQDALDQSFRMIKSMEARLSVTALRAYLIERPNDLFGGLADHEAKALERLCDLTEERIKNGKATDLAATLDDLISGNYQSNFNHNKGHNAFLVEVRDFTKFLQPNSQRNKDLAFINAIIEAGSSWTKKGAKEKSDTQYNQLLVMLDQGLVLKKAFPKTAFMVAALVSNFSNNLLSISAAKKTAFDFSNRSTFSYVAEAFLDDPMLFLPLAGAVGVAAGTLARFKKFRKVNVIANMTSNFLSHRLVHLSSTVHGAYYTYKTGKFLLDRDMYGTTSTERVAHMADLYLLGVAAFFTGLSVKAHLHELYTNASYFKIYWKAQKEINAYRSAQYTAAKTIEDKKLVLARCKKLEADIPAYAWHHARVAGRVARTRSLNYELWGEHAKGRITADLIDSPATRLRNMRIASFKAWATASKIVDFAVIPGSFAAASVSTLTKYAVMQEQGDDSNEREAQIWIDALVNLFPASASLAFRWAHGSHLTRPPIKTEELVKQPYTDAELLRGHQRMRQDVPPLSPLKRLLIKEENGKAIDGILATIKEFKKVKPAREQVKDQVDENGKNKKWAEVEEELRLSEADKQENPNQIKLMTEAEINRFDFHSTYHDVMHGYNSITDKTIARQARREKQIKAFHRAIKSMDTAQYQLLRLKGKFTASQVVDMLFEHPLFQDSNIFPNNGWKMKLLLKDLAKKTDARMRDARDEFKALKPEDQTIESMQRVLDGHTLGDFDGVFVGVKDAFPDPTGKARIGSNNFLITDDKDAAFVYRQLLKQGALPIPVGMVTAANGGTGKNTSREHLRSAANPNEDSGGSSSASAYVSRREDILISFTLGTDVFGSIRVPSMLQSLYGFVPPQDYIPRTGMYPSNYKQGTIGVLSPHYEGGKKLMKALGVEDPRAPQLGNPQEYLKNVEGESTLIVVDLRLLRNNKNKSAVDDFLINLKKLEDEGYQVLFMNDRRYSDFRYIETINYGRKVYFYAGLTVYNPREGVIRLGQREVDIATPTYIHPQHEKQFLERVAKALELQEMGQVQKGRELDAQVIAQVNRFLGRNVVFAHPEVEHIPMNRTPKEENRITTEHDHTNGNFNIMTPEGYASMIMQTNKGGYSIGLIGDFNHVQKLADAIYEMHQ